MNFIESFIVKYKLLCETNSKLRTRSMAAANVRGPRMCPKMRHVRRILNRTPAGISTARVAIRIVDYRSGIAIHVTRMIFGRGLRNAQEIIHGIFWFTVIKYSYGRTVSDMFRLLFNEIVAANEQI